MYQQGTKDVFPENFTGGDDLDVVSTENNK